MKRKYRMLLEIDVECELRLQEVQELILDRLENKPSIPVSFDSIRITNIPSYSSRKRINKGGE